MHDTIHMVLPGTRDLVSPYLIHEASRPIRTADCFTVSVDTVVVAENLDGFFGGGNDLLVVTRSALGNRPRVERVHVFGEDIEPGRPLRNMFANLVHVAEDYQDTERLWLEFVVLEIDSLDGERRAASEAFELLAATTGAVFPVLLPYTQAAAALARLADRLVEVLNTDDTVLRCPIAFHGGAPRPGRIPIQEASYVLFPQPVAPGALQLAPNGILLEDGRPSDRSYIVFSVFSEKAVSRVHLNSQRVATLLTQLREGNENSARSTMEYLRETIEAFGDMKRLKRFQELMARKPLSEAERSQLDLIRDNPRLQPFVHSQTGRDETTVRVRTF